MTNPIVGTDGFVRALCDARGNDASANNFNVERVHTRDGPFNNELQSYDDDYAMWGAYSSFEDDSYYDSDELEMHIWNFSHMPLGGRNDHR